MLKSDGSLADKQRCAAGEPSPVSDAQLDRASEALATQAAVARATARQRVARAQLISSRTIALAQEASAHVDRSGESTYVRRTDDEGSLRRIPLRAPTSGGSVAFILKEDPELAQGLSANDQRLAHELFRARVLRATSRQWEPPQYYPPNCFGLLVLDGLIGRRVHVGSAMATELLTCGDIVRPWDTPFPWSSLAAGEDWRVFRPARLALLDERITALIGRRPELVAAFSERLIRRARAIVYLMAISHLPRVEDKLLGTLWHLATRCGHVTPRGVKVPFRLTHEALGEIIGARRPSVTLAMRNLKQRNQLTRDPDGGYLLTGDPAEWDRRT
jgi:hypothetical protein